MSKVMDDIFVVRHIGDNYSQATQTESIIKAVEEYQELLDKGFMHEDIRLEIWVYSEFLRKYEFSYDFVVDVKVKH